MTCFHAGFEVEDSRIVPRDPKSQWYVTREQWEDDSYPVWYQGLAYMISIPLVKKISLMAEGQPYLFVDDVFVGILISKTTPVTYHQAGDLSCHHLDLSSRSLTKHLYWRYYFRKTVFYHLPLNDLFEQWWLCGINNSCKRPLVMDLLAIIPILYYFILFSLVFVISCRRRLLLRFKSQMRFSGCF